MSGNENVFFDYQCISKANVELFKTISTFVGEWAGAFGRASGATDQFERRRVA
jgi:hypothetical protein